MKAYNRVGYIDAVFLTVKALLGVLNINSTHQFIKARMPHYLSYPAFTTKDVSALLQDAFGIKNEIVEIDVEHLDEIAFPAITFFEYNEGCYVLLMAASADEIEIEHPYIGPMRWKKKDFLPHWRGFLILITEYEPDFSEPDFTKRHREEAREVEWFKEHGVRLIPAFITDVQCDRLVAYIEEKAKLEAKNPNTNFSVGPHQLTKLFETIIQQTEQVIGTSRDYFDDVICVRYLEGHLNSLHYDVVDEALGKHIISFLIYLNDDFEAGETCFPQAGIKIKPRKGAALLFRNFNDASQVIDCSVHAGLPPMGGAKYTCNIWVSKTPLYIIR